MSPSCARELMRIHERLLDVKARGYRLMELSVIVEDLGRLRATVEMLSDDAEAATLERGLADVVRFP